ncbi:MAG: hypothetical protein EXS13_11895 [Planctomycetes bacterium]|nr:hypothetical protein [Planctomycetota bacterium]
MFPARHWLIGAAFTIATAFATSAASAADGLELYRRSEDGVVNFFVRGARPGEEVLLAVTNEIGQVFIGAATADPTGAACIQIALPLDARELPRSTLLVQAQVYRGALQPIVSNVVELCDPALLWSDLPLLWMVIERGDSSSTVLRFDAMQRSLDEIRRGRGRRDGVLAASGATAVIKEDGTLIALDDLTVATFPDGEEPINLALTADDAMAVLTREAVGDGRTLLRVRLLDAAQINREIDSFEVHRTSSRLVSAWLVAAEDSHRVLVAERSVGVRELVLGESISPGVTLLPLAADGREELVDCAVMGDWIAVTTRMLNGRDGRLLVADLTRRTAPSEHALHGRPVGLALAGGDAGPAAFVAIDGGPVGGGSVERIALADGARQSIELPGVVRLAASRSGDHCFALASTERGEGAALYSLSSELGSAVTLATFGPLARSVPELGVIAANGREWVWLIERRFVATRPGGAQVDDQLWWTEVHPTTGAELESASRRAVGGRVRGITSR